jgi:hypothetical protein
MFLRQWHGNAASPSTGPAVPIWATLSTAVPPRAAGRRVSSRSTQATIATGIDATTSVFPCADRHRPVSWRVQLIAELRGLNLHRCVPGGPLSTFDRIECIHASTRLCIYYTTVSYGVHFVLLHRHVSHAQRCRLPRFKRQVWDGSIPFELLLDGGHGVVERTQAALSSSSPVYDEPPDVSVRRFHDDRVDLSARPPRTQKCRVSHILLG